MADDAGQFTKDPNEGCPPSGFNRCSSSRAKRAIGASPVVPWIRTFATSRSHPARCASNGPGAPRRHCRDADEPLAQPTVKAVETLRPLRRLERLHPARRHVAFHRGMAAAQLPRNPLQTPPARPQAQHLGHVMRRLHHLPPWITPRRAFSEGFIHSLPSYPRRGQFLVTLRGAVFHGARHTSRRMRGDSLE
ncbi:hypothetical protein GA0061098_10635 [Bradyrhizobium shewense]|uniref:Uncharacterized protein n=1 Tax=Bradyrhizobium shewense TaxID=1761772 RepID=A0A1C3XUH4_9BRAD|nr:hypothetical protein GA0061098_10635 [Bradyrhizobium shewense]